MRKETSATTSRIKPRAEHPRGLIRTAVEAHIERRRQDPEFMARLKARIDQDQRLLAKLAKN